MRKHENKNVIITEHIAKKDINIFANDFAGLLSFFSTPSPRVNIFAPGLSGIYL